jgi:hypothetical protein
MERPRTTTSLVIEATSAQPVAVPTSVTRASQRAAKRGLSSGTGYRSTGPLMSGTRREASGNAGTPAG